MTKLKKNEDKIIIETAIRDLCDADKAKTNYLVHRVRQFVVLENILKYFRSETSRQLTLF